MKDCGFCKTKIPNDSIYCPECGKLLSSYKPAILVNNTSSKNVVRVNKNNTDVAKRKKGLISVICIAAIIALIIVVILCSSYKPRTSSVSGNSSNNNVSAGSSTSTTSSNSSGTTNITNSNYYNSNTGINSSPASPSNSNTSNLTPYSVYNGKIIINPTYDKLCPLTVNTESGSNYYIYLDYIGTPASSAQSRTGKSGESDLAFYIVGGKSVEVNVPVGKYKLYYATGQTFYGPKYLFGDSKTYSSDDYLVFYVTETYDMIYYEGCELTLYGVINGNFDTETIRENDFPVRAQ